MKKIIYLIQFLIIKFLFIIFNIIGYKNASNFGALIGRTFGELIRSKKIIIKNLSYIKEFSKLEINESQIVSEVFSNYGRILAEYNYLYKFRQGKLSEYINVQGKEYLDQLRRENKKAIFISGHFNNFELMAMIIDMSGVNLAAIYRPLNNIYLNKTMEDIRVKHICKNQIKKGKSGTKELISFLKKNYSIALMIDQRVSEGIKCNFFGRPAFTTTIPAQILKKYDCEIVPVYIERYDKIKFNLTINKPIKFNNKLSDVDITSQLNQILEDMIVKNPAQWILTHNRWK